MEVKLLEKKANQEVTQCKFDAFSFILTDRINIIDTFSVVFSKTVILVLVKVWLYRIIFLELFSITLHQILGYSGTNISATCKQ